MYHYHNITASCLILIRVYSGATTLRLTENYIIIDNLAFEVNILFHSNTIQFFY